MKQIFHEMSQHKLLILLLVLNTPILLMIMSPQFLESVIQNSVPLAMVTLIFIIIFLAFSVCVSVFFINVLILLFPMHWRLRYMLFAVELIAPILIFNGLPPSFLFVLRTKYGPIRTALEVILFAMTATGATVIVQVLIGKPISYSPPSHDEVQR